MCLVAAARQADDRAAGVHIPARCAETGERGHEVHAAVIRHALGQNVALVCRSDQAELITQPLDGAAGIEHAALERIGRLTIDRPRNARDQTADAAHGFAAGIHEREAAGAVRIFCLARHDACLAQQGGRLVAGAAADRYALERLKPRKPRRHLPIHHGRWHRHRQHAHRDAEACAQLLVPAEIINVKQHRARAVGVIRHMGAAAGQIPDEPRIHVAEQQLAALGTLARTGNVIEDPLDLRAGEIGVNEQAGLFLHIRAETVGRELVADGRRAAALPDDCVIDGLAGVLVPDDRRLALVRDADAGDVRRRQAALFKRLAHGKHLTLKDDHRVMFHPARFWVDLREGILRQRHNVALTVENNRAGTGCTLVKCNDVAVHNSH